MDPCVHSSCGTVVRTLLHGFLSAPSWHPCTSLACGWAFASDRHPMTTSVWLTGATTVTHCARFSVFLGCPLSHQRWPLWGAVIRRAVQGVPEGAVLRVSVDATTKTNAGTPSAGRARSRHGAGAARHADRTLRGVTCVLGIRHLPLPRWPGHSRSVPLGCARSRTAPHAQPRNVPYQSRRPLARALLDCVAEQVPGRPLRRLADGGSATKEAVRPWPKTAHGVGRCPSRATLDALPPPPAATRRGAPRTNGALLGSPKTLGQTATGGGRRTPAQRAQPSQPGRAGGLRGALGASCGSWCGGVRAKLPPQGQDKETHSPPSQPFAPPSGR